MNEEKLNNLIWHDSVLQEIIFVRTNSLDQVILKLNLIIDYEKQLSELTKIIFKDCLIVNSKMNWGVICMSEGEMIHSGKSSFNKENISKYLNKWNRDKIDEFREFKLELASTESELFLIFKGFEIIRIGELDNHSAPPPLGIKE